MAMRRPSNSDRTWATYTQEFHVHVWAMLAAAVVAFSIGLYLASATVKKEKNLTFSETFLIVFGVLCGQGCYVVFRKLPSRLVLMTVLLLQVVMLAHYTSTLVSALSVAPALPAISSISDLLRNPALSFGTTGDTAILGYLKNSPRLDHQQAYDHMMTVGGRALVASTAQGMARTLLENYVYLDTSLYLLSESDCRHVILPKAHFTAITSFALQKDSPLVPIFNKIILRIKAGGVLLNLERRWRPGQLNCEFTHASVIGLDAVFTPFLLLLLIMVFSVAVCAAEHLWRAMYTRTSTINIVTPVNHTKDSQTF